METSTPTQQVPVQQPQHIRPKLGKNVLSFWAVIFGIVFVVLCAFGFLIAKTGLAQVPVFSRFYRGPQPTRVVEAPKTTVADFRDLLGKRLFLAQLSSPQADTVSVSVSETELTSVLQDAITQAVAGQEARVEHVQLVVLDDQIELVALIRRSGVRADVLVRFKPKIEGSAVVFEPSFFQLGDFSLPVSFAEQFAALLFSRDLGKWEVSSPQFKVDRVVLHLQSIEIVVRRTAR